MESGSDAKPTIEALEDERRRLRELERNLAAEHDRVQAVASSEIARMQEVLRDAADRAARREHELEVVRKRLERKLADGRLGRLVARRGRGAGAGAPNRLDQRELALAHREASLDDRERALIEIAARTAADAERLEELRTGLVAGHRDVDRAEALDTRARALAARADDLTAREVELEQKVDELVDAERRSNEQLAARRAELDAREQAPVSDSPSPPVAVDQKQRSADLPAGGEEGAAQLHEVEQREAALVDRSTVLDAREAELVETIAALEQRERELALLRDQLEAERSRLAARTRRLGEAERRAPIRTAYRPQAVGFSEGLQALARKRGAP